ncbi:hypothetical protein D4R42_00715 [bacterium]|nr:MAG: hypothetical protein D4R42_00715 [bacterium]
MTSQTVVDNILIIIRKAVSSSLNEQIANVSIELKELSKIGQVFSITGTFKVAPFFVTRSGEISVTLLQSERGLEITNLKIEEGKGL